MNFKTEFNLVEDEYLGTVLHYSRVSSTKFVYNMERILIYIILLPLEILNSIAHGIGSYLLISLHKSERRKTTQRVCLINLSVNECAWNILVTIRGIIKIIDNYCYDDQRFDLAFWCIDAFIGTGGNYIIISSMFLLTVDRLLHVSQGLRYANDWGVNKTWKVVIGTSVVNVIIGLSTAFCCYYLPENISKVYKIIQIINTCLYGLYLVFAGITNIAIFKKYVKSKKRMAKYSSTKSNLSNASSSQIKKNTGIASNTTHSQTINNSIATIEPSSLQKIDRTYTTPNASSSQTRINTNTAFNSSPSTWELFKVSKFFIPVLLISSFLIFVVVPSLTRSIYSAFNKPSKTQIYYDFAYFLSHRISFIVDAFIYTYFQKSVRNFLMKTLRIQRVSDAPDRSSRPSTVSRDENTERSKTRRFVEIKDYKFLDKGAVNKDDAPLENVAVPKDDIPLENVAAHKDDILLENVTVHKDDSIPLENVTFSKDDILLENVTAHKDETPLENVAVHKDDIPLENVAAHKDDMLLEKVTVHKNDSIPLENFTFSKDDIPLENVTVSKDDIRSENVTVHKDDILLENVTAYKDETPLENVAVDKGDTPLEKVTVHQDDISSDNVTVHKDDSIPLENVTFSKDDIPLENVTVHKDYTPLENVTVNKDDALLENVTVHNDDTPLENVTVNRDDISVDNVTAHKDDTPLENVTINKDETTLKKKMLRKITQL